ncbi:MAG: hypothetical protein Q4G39_09580, partial [Brachymonas sp.]|nr:hypothetical protein [Brachymonas sp.]
KPMMYTDTRRGKAYAQAQFSNGSVSYGKTGSPLETSPMQYPVFDLFSLTWQLALNNIQLPTGLQITNGKKLYPVSQVHKIGSGQIRVNGKDIKVERYRVQREGNSVEYAFAPDLHNIPAEATYTNDGKTYTFKLKNIKLDGELVAASQ